MIFLLDQNETAPISNFLINAIGFSLSSILIYNVLKPATAIMLQKSDEAKLTDLNRAGRDKNMARVIAENKLEVAAMGANHLTGVQKQLLEEYHYTIDEDFCTLYNCPWNQE